MSFMWLGAFFFLSVAFFVLLSLLHSSEAVEESPHVFECGFTPLWGVKGVSISAQFYLLGMVFLVFDVEVVMLLPLPFFSGGGDFLLCWFLILLITGGLAYEWWWGALSWV